MAKMIAAKKTKAALSHAVVCPNVTGRAKTGIGQSKRARAGSLAIVGKTQVTQTWILRVFLFASHVILPFFDVTFVLCFCFAFVFLLFLFH